MKKNIKLILALSFSILFLSSCLRDENIENQEYGIIGLNNNKIIEIPITDANHKKTIALLDKGTTDVEIGEVRLAAENPAEVDIKVEISLINDRSVLLKAARKRFGISDDIKDSSILSFGMDDIKLPESVVIPKGKRSVPIIAKINTNKLLGESQYVLIEIKKVLGNGYIISGNFKDLLIDLKSKSLYEGDYNYEVNSSLGGNPGKIFLSTVTPNKVKFNLINKYSNEVFYIIDPLTNKVTIESPSLDPVAVTLGEYDPDKKSFHVIWSGRGGKYTFDETFTMIK